MAAAKCPEISRSKDEFVDEFLTCSICAEPYNNDDHRAKCLPCLHTYCKSCLESLAGKREQFDCPNCRKTVKPPGKTIDSLPNNFLVENLREYKHIFDQEVQCGNCEKGNLAVRFCRNCVSFQCQRCTENHAEMRNMRHHELVTFEDLQAKKYNPVVQQKPYCQHHPNQELNMYCKGEECNIAVCASCGLVDHRTHDIVHLDAAIDKIVNTIRHSAAGVQNKCKELKKMRATGEAAKKILADNYTRVEENIGEWEQKLLDLIKVHGTKTRGNLKKMYEAELQILNANMESMDHLVAQMNSAFAFASQTCDMRHQLQLVTTQTQIMERLGDLEKVALPCDKLNDKVDFDFTAKHCLAMAQIEESVQSLGDIRWKSKVDPQQCTIKLGLATDRKGYWKKAVIQTIGTDGREIAVGGADINVKQAKGATYHVQDNHDGSYVFEYDASVRSLLHIIINGVEMEGSPVDIDMIDPGQCTIETGLYADSGFEKAVVQAVDVNGVKMTIGGARIEAAQGGTLKVSDNNDGTYTTIYNPFLYNPLDVKINGISIKGSPIEFRRT